MKRDNRLAFGPVAAAILSAGIAGLPLIVPGYDPIRQTVSEIGEAGSPAQLSFTIMLCLVALSVLVFATALARRATERGLSGWAAYLTGAMAISAAGVGVFAFPHPLHNVFGLSELIGYQAPLVLALTWRRDPEAKAAVAFSWAMAVLVSVMIALNLVSIARGTALWAHIQPFYGLVQRGLFASWFAWCAGLGLILPESAQLTLRPRARE